MKLIDYIDFDLLSYNEILKLIRSGKHFSFARYGDGEFNAIIGRSGANCDGHEYTPSMGNELAYTLKSSPDYYLGLHQDKRTQHDTLNWLQSNSIVRKFASNAVFHCALRDGHMDQLWQALKSKEVVIVAPAYVKAQIVVSADLFIEIPGANTYNHLGDIKHQLDRLDFAGKIVLICASMTAPLIVDYLYQSYRSSATFIDFGSTFDPYCGIKSRSFHQIKTE